MTKLKNIFFTLLIISIVICSVNININASSVIVASPKKFYVYDDISTAFLSWSKVKNSDGYIVQKSTNNKKWKTVSTLSGVENRKYSDLNLSKGKYYYYRIKAFKTINKKKKYSKSTVVRNVKGGMDFYLSTNSTSVNLNWQRINSAKGYEIYFSINSGEFKKIKTFKNNFYTFYSKTRLDTNNNNYKFYIKCFRNSNNKKDYFYQSDLISSNNFTSIINGTAGESKNSFPLVNVQGKKSKTSCNVSVSKADKNIFEKYAENNFNENISPNDMIKSVFWYIHSNVKYATGDSYAKVCNCSSYADAIMNENIGQCAEYNGAMAQYLSFLGYNVKLIQGYRGTSNNNRWQHFWCEVVINNKTYVVETGNEGQDGSWNYYFKPYSQTKKYIKCNKYVSGIKP